MYSFAYCLLNNKRRVVTKVPVVFTVFCFSTCHYVFYWLYFEFVRSLVQFRALFTVTVVELSRGIDAKAKYSKYA